MKHASTLALALLASCATAGAPVREAPRPRPDLVGVARAMTAIDAAERRGAEIVGERQKRSAAAEADPKDPTARFLAVYAQPRGEDRWAEFRALWKEYPDSAFGQIGMASVYVEWKTLDQADRAVAAALEQEPDEWLAVRYRAETSEKRGRLEFAAEDYRTVLSADPKNPEAHLGLARIARAKGDAEAAVREAETALREAPDLFGAHVLLAAVASDKGDKSTAAAHWALAVEAGPRDREARVTLAKLLRQEGDAKGAAAQWRAALQLKEDADGLAALAEAAHAAHDSRTELEAIERLSAVDPSSAEWRRVAEIRLASQDWEGAEKALRRALARDPRDAAANAGLGQVCLHRGASQEAVEAFRAAGEAGKGELAALEKRLNLERVARPDVSALQRAVQSLVDRTYRARLSGAPSLSGVLKVRVTVGPSGAASLVEVLEDSVHDPDVRACAYWNLRDAGYPQNKPGRYSFTFAFRR
ncbi:MAG TPA: tetratricopeptide repeat protein [Anaeromyxobacter sp.]